MPERAREVARVQWMKAGTQHRGAVLLTVVVLAVGILAAFHRGVPVADLRLNDGGVGVTNLTDGLVAHLNYPSRTLDSGLRVSAGDFDITQAGNSIVLHDTEHAQAQPVDPAFAILGTAPKIPEGMRLVHGGSTALVVDSGGGRIWALDAGKLNAFSPEADPTVAKVKGVKAVVGLDGVGRLVTPDGAVRRITAQQDGWHNCRRRRAEGLSGLAERRRSAVGDQVVAVDTVKRVVWSHHGREALDAGEVVTVQQPGENSDSVTLATANALLRVPLSGGDVAELPAGGAGRAAAPVVVAGCAYAAWSGSGAYVRDCPGTADDVTKTGLAFDDTDDLVLPGVNRNVVVLNNVANGDTISSTTRCSWSTTGPTSPTRPRSAPTRRTTPARRSLRPLLPSATRTIIHRSPRTTNSASAQADPPPAAGLINDADPDGDVLTATVAKSPSLGSIRQVRGGEALQIEVPDKASGRAIIASPSAMAVAERPPAAQPSASTRGPKTKHQNRCAPARSSSTARARSATTSSPTGSTPTGTPSPWPARARRSACRSAHAPTARSPCAIWARPPLGQRRRPHGQRRQETERRHT